MKLNFAICSFFLFSALLCVDGFSIVPPLLQSKSSTSIQKYRLYESRIGQQQHHDVAASKISNQNQGYSHNHSIKNQNEERGEKLNKMIFDKKILPKLFVSFCVSMWISSSFSLKDIHVNALPERPPESNAQAILLEAIPSPSSPSSLPGLQLVKNIGLELTKMTSEGSGNIRSVDAKGQKGVKGWAEATKIYRNVESKVNQKEVQAKILKDANGGEEIYEDLRKRIANLGVEIANQDREATVANQIDALRDLDKLAVKSYEVSSQNKIREASIDEYKDQYPILNGRAELEMVVRSKKNMDHRGTVILTLDGINAPVTSGCFFDLVEKGYFDSKKIVVVDESSVVFGDDKESKTGFNNIPFEVKIQGEDTISYEETFEEQLKYKAKPQLPFSAYGALAMLHPNGNPNGATGNQAFFLKFDPIYTPAGLNTLDGNYAVFGYVTKGAIELDDLEVNDIIESVKVLDGKEYMSYPSPRSK